MSSWKDSLQPGVAIEVGDIVVNKNDEFVIVCDIDSEANTYLVEGRCVCGWLAQSEWRLAMNLKAGQLTSLMRRAVAGTISGDEVLKAMKIIEGGASDSEIRSMCKDLTKN